MRPSSPPPSPLNQIDWFSNQENQDQIKPALIRWNIILIMETPAFIYAIFLWFLLISVTGYSIYVGFGPPSKELKDPFEDHED